MEFIIAYISTSHNVLVETYMPLLLSLYMGLYITKIFTYVYDISTDALIYCFNVTKQLDPKLQVELQNRIADKVKFNNNRIFMFNKDVNNTKVVVESNQKEVEMQQNKNKEGNVNDNTAGKQQVKPKDEEVQKTK